MPKTISLEAFRQVIWSMWWLWGSRPLGGPIGFLLLYLPRFPASREVLFLIPAGGAVIFAFSFSCQLAFAGGSAVQLPASEATASPAMLFWFPL